MTTAAHVPTATGSIAVTVQDPGDTHAGDQFRTFKATVTWTGDSDATKPAIPAQRTGSEAEP